MYIYCIINFATWFENRNVFSSCVFISLNGLMAELSAGRSFVFCELHFNSIHPYIFTINYEEKTKKKARII